MLLNQVAPSFSAAALFPGKDSAKSITITDYFGQWIVLFFNPFVFSKVCPAELLTISGVKPAFDELNCQIFAISCDSEENLRNWLTTSRSDGGLEGLQVPLVSDVNRIIAKKFGILGKDGNCLRATIVLSPNGIVRHYSVNDAVVGRNVDEYIRIVKAFQLADESGEVCSANWRPGEETLPADLIGGKDSKPPVTLSNCFGSCGDNGQCCSLFSLVETLGQKYKNSLQTAPVCTKALTSLVVGIIGEIIGSYIQARKAGKEMQLNVRRMTVFGAYGLLVTGPFFHWWYGKLERIIASFNLTSFPSILASKLAVNQLVMTPPFVLFSLLFIQYFLSLDHHKTIRAVRNTYAAALFTNWKVWTVAQAVNFSVVPMEYRVLYGNLVAVWWNIYLSIVNTAPAPSR